MEVFTDACLFALSLYQWPVVYRTNFDIQAWESCPVIADLPTSLYLKGNWLAVWMYAVFLKIWSLIQNDFSRCRQNNTVRVSWCASFVVGRLASTDSDIFCLFYPVVKIFFF